MILLKSIPKVDKFVSHEAFLSYSKPLITKIAKEVLNQLREDILEKKVLEIVETVLVKQVITQYNQQIHSSLQPLINATGVIVHTNLGRSLIPTEAFEKVKELVSHYNNLEYDLEKGKRGERYEHVSKLLCNFLGCEDVLVVNNNASAVFLVLNTFAKNKEVVVSRGELVEIGGSFRVPEVMSQSGAKLKEIGTTNKTHLKDYEEAITPETSMLMKVHKSNYSIEGFTSEVAFKDIIQTAQNNGIIDYYDMGSGHMVDLPYNLDKKEPKVQDILAFNPSLLSFSGDKLLGSVQAGIIVGKKELIAQLKKNQLLRMLRVDKITLSLLEQTIQSLYLGQIDKIPTLKMLFTTIQALKDTATKIQKSLDNIEHLSINIIETQTVIGGGTTPNQKIPTIALQLHYKNLKANEMEQKFRAKKIIGRIENDIFLLDLRSVQEEELPLLINTIKEMPYE